MLNYGAKHRRADDSMTPCHSAGVFIGVAEGPGGWDQYHERGEQKNLIVRLHLRRQHISSESCNPSDRPG